ncbi:serine protease inhibitor dipetalogastin-like [Ostrea edulis]|uniref:serine protease inhibitor dipetalogastin-like n=1 Tax=Ostrea edulis TaxID=37623 RepID=UPI0024AFAE5C|nr:serine protease inhibitor dipetalogastin-like [Ostrea edulis]
MVFSTFSKLCVVWAVLEVTAMGKDTTVEIPCLYTCSARQCRYGYLPVGCPRCQCAPNPCLFSQCPTGFSCSTEPSDCGYPQCPHKAVCIHNTKNGEQPCGCRSDFSPVCGADGQTYPNDCTRYCAGVLKNNDGFCHCKCSRFYDPVCGADGQFFINKCFLQCRDTAMGTHHLCPCQCPLTVNTVCGVDGQTYINECVLSCAGIPKRQNGSCECLKMCNSVRRPVCGSDFVTYTNDCHRKCAGVDVSVRRPCTTPPRRQNTRTRPSLARQL